MHISADATTYGAKYVKGTHFMYVLKEKPAVYAGIHLGLSVPLSVALWKSWSKPLRMLAAGGAFGKAFLHYILHGPKVPDDSNRTEETKGG